MVFETEKFSFFSELESSKPMDGSSDLSFVQGRNVRLVVLSLSIRMRNLDHSSSSPDLESPCTPIAATNPLQSQTGSGSCQI